MTKTLALLQWRRDCNWQRGSAPISGYEGQGNSGCACSPIKDSIDIEWRKPGDAIFGTGAGNGKCQEGMSLNWFQIRLFPLFFHFPSRALPKDYFNETSISALTLWSSHNIHIFRTTGVTHVVLKVRKFHHGDANRMQKRVLEWKQKNSPRIPRHADWHVVISW